MWIYLLIGIITSLVLFVRRKYLFWERQGVPFIKPKFPFGNLLVNGKRVHTSQLTTYYYNALKGKKHPIGGVFFFTTPFAVVLDRELMRNVLIQDFQHFHDRGLYYNEKDDPISCHLFNIEGSYWTNLRKKLSPIFSSGKLKLMCPMVITIAERFQKCLSKSITQNQQEAEMKEWLNRFTIDVIGTCAFGIECNSLTNPEEKFRKMGVKMFHVANSRIIKFFFISLFKNLAKKVHIKSVPEDVSEFFFKVIRKTIAFREMNHVLRNDFINLSMQLMADGKLEGSDEDVGKITLNEVVAQSFVFFLAGYETSSTVMMFCLYELSLQEDIQRRARENVITAVSRHGGLNYDALMDMGYLDQCVETMRKYPPAGNLGRCVTKDYNIPNTNITLRKGLNVVIPVHGIHHDAEYYPDPERFDPERFSAEESTKRLPFTFMPFGEGPRNCIAARFGMLMAKVGVASMLMRFQFSKCSKTAVPLVISPKHASMSPEGGMWLKVKEIK
ncbi:AAEL010158-PA [Aedes aegypti]|uniref:AAEL010158-PA n=1 Tax=Aedes aegypti TaxID=7159 RepID=Q16TQ9_AEDAE|nr:AAEL010158-PA [Aedes aegypti]